MFDKKGIVPLIPVAISGGLLLAFAVVLVVFFLGFIGIAFVLSKNVYQLVGGAIIVIVALTIFKFKTVPNRAVIPLLFVGLFLVMLPIFVETLQGHTLAVITGGG